MARVAIGNFPVFAEYEPGEIERKVEEGLNEVGLKLQEAKMQVGEVLVNEEAERIFGLDYGDQNPYLLGYERDSSDRFNGFQIQYGKSIVTPDSIDIEEALHRLKSDDDTCHYISFTRELPSHISFETYSQQKGVKVSLWETVQESDVAVQMRAHLYRTYKNRHQPVDSDDFYTVNISDVFKSTLDFLKKT